MYTIIILYLFLLFSSSSCFLCLRKNISSVISCTCTHTHNQALTYTVHLYMYTQRCTVGIKDDIHVQCTCTCRLPNVSLTSGLVQLDGSAKGSNGCSFHAGTRENHNVYIVYMYMYTRTHHTCTCTRTIHVHCTSLWHSHHPMTMCNVISKHGPVIILDIDDKHVL